MTSKLDQAIDLSSGLRLRNRVAMAPMTTWSANPDATISDEEDRYYRARVSGLGLVITGCSHVTPNGVGFTDEFAAFDDHFQPSLQRLAAAAKSGGAPAILQIFHAGNKAVPSLIPGGDIVAPSPVSIEATAFASGKVVPRSLSDDEIQEIITDFGQATRRAIEAGFDGVELHGAHGFLIQNFLSPRFNKRDDVWGGSLENRMRFPLAIIAEVQRVITDLADRPFALGYRISPEEPGEGGLQISDSFTLLDRLIDASVDYVHVSLGSVLEDRPSGATDGPLLIERILERVAGRLPVLAAGRLRTPEQARHALALGLSVVAIGQGLVMVPDWMDHALGARRDAIETVLDLSREDLVIPAKLRSIIASTPGWFEVRTEASVPPNSTA